MEDTDAIVAALETHLRTLPELPPVAWENVNFTPVNGTPYVAPFTLFTEPDDAGFRDSSNIQRGYMQIGLHFPTNTGAGAARTLAKRLRRHFPRGSSYVAGGVKTNILATPEITGGTIEEGRYVVRVRVRFYAELQGT